MELTEEEYDLTKMKAIRSSQIEEAKKAKKWGVVLGTLGRQGNEAILERLKTILKAREKEFVVVLLSELSDGVVSVARRLDRSCARWATWTAGCKLHARDSPSTGARPTQSRC